MYTVHPKPNAANWNWQRKMFFFLSKMWYTVDWWVSKGNQKAKWWYWAQAERTLLLNGLYSSCQTTLTWFGFGFATRFSFDPGCSLLRLCSRLFALFAAFADPPPGGAGHKQRRGRLSTWTDQQPTFSVSHQGFKLDASHTMIMSAEHLCCSSKKQNNLN